MENARKVADPIYANTRGAAWIGAVGLGEISFKDIPDLVEIEKSYTPQAKYRELYDQRYTIFTRIYKQMKGIYQELNQ